MEEKVDKQDFLNEIAALRAMIGEIDKEDKKKPKIQTVITPTQAAFNSKEVSKIKEMMERMPAIEDML